MCSFLTEVYSGHNGGASSSSSSVTSKKTRRLHAIPIIDPKTGNSISNELYESDSSNSGEGAPQVQVSEHKTLSTSNRLEEFQMRNLLNNSIYLINSSARLLTNLKSKALISNSI